jgi:predicted dehydrogenase
LASRLRWGVLGTGRMAGAFAAEIPALCDEGHELVAVASRRRQTAADFAARYGIADAVGSYRELTQHDAVDAVYIATPSSLHAASMLDCIAAGKAVLCEKPFTINGAEAANVIDAARRRGTFVMEAMWTRFLPSLVALRKMLREGAIGRVDTIVGGGAFIPSLPPGHYLYEPALGGGVLLDAGVYLISLASMVLGPPTRVLASGLLGASGIDERSSVLLEHADGGVAQLYVSLRARRPPDLEILGGSGRIRIEAPVFRPCSLTVWDAAGQASSLDFPIRGSGYGYQLREFAAVLRAGRIESDIMPLAETQSIMRTMDAVREQIGLVYPAERTVTQGD